MKNAITILALLIVGLGVLAWGFAALNACLLPVELPDTDPGDSSRIFPSREGILLSTAHDLYRQSVSGKFDTPVAGLGTGECANVVDIFNTLEGVFVITGIGDCKSDLYRFTAKKGLEPVLGETDRQNFVRVERICDNLTCDNQASDNVFVFLIDFVSASPPHLAVYKLEAGKSEPQSLAKVDQCTIRDLGYTKTQSSIFFLTANGSLCKLGNRGLDLISGWTNDILWGAAETTSRGAFLWGGNGVYWLDKNNRVGKIEGISGDRVILGFDEMSLDHGLGRVFVRTTNGLFVYSQAGVLTPVPGLVPSNVPSVVHSVHEIRRDLYVLASNGVFHLSEEGRLKRIEEKDIEGKDKDIGGVRHAGYKTSEGVFFISSDDQTYRLTDSSKPIRQVTLPGDANFGKTEKPRDIKETRVGPLLATGRAVYRFSKVNGWILIRSGDLRGDVSIIPVPKIGGVTADVPVFVQTWNGVFKWIESPFDVKTAKELWNYIRIFWNEVGTILVSLLVILFVFVHYSLYRYRRVRYYMLGLVAPSRVHNQIFISYRRTDTGGHAFNLYEQLCRRFDRELIFFDLENIESADVFPTKLHDAVEQCSVLLALIASDWLNARKADGSPRLDDPNDYVRQEISLALAHGKIVIPVLFGDVTMPDARCLPEPLKPLSARNAERLHVGEMTSVFRTDVDRLSRLLATFPNIPPPKR